AAVWQQRSPKGVRRWLWGSGLAIVTLLLVALLHLSLGTLQKPSRFAWFGGFLPAQSDASVQLLDIHQIRQGFIDSPVLARALKQADFVFTSEIFLAGQVSMALAPLNPPPLTSFTEDLRGFAYWSTAEQWVGKNGLYLTSTRLADITPYQTYFETIQKIGEIPIQRGGAIVEVIQIYYCQNLLKPYPRPMKTQDVKGF
ncbi:MAG: glycosyltransferase, partial [Leptodesmis sp.]